MKVIICLGISLNGKQKPVFIEYEFSMTILVHFGMAHILKLVWIEY